MATKLTTMELAEKLDTDPKRLRRFLRAEGLGVSKGSRYAIEASRVRTLKKRFDAWTNIHTRNAA